MVAILVLLSEVSGVGAVGTPVNTGLDIGAYEVKSVAGITEIAVSTYVFVAAWLALLGVGTDIDPLNT